MSEETPAPQADSAPAAAAASPAPPAARKLPPWLSYVLAALLPALIVGLAVYLLFAGDGGGGGSSETAGILESFISDNAGSYSGRFPPSFPREFPVFKGAKVIASFVVDQSDEGQGTTFIAVLSTSAPAQEVYDFYTEALDEDPFQVEIAQSGREGDYVQFSRPDNADVQGAVVIFHSDLGDVTSIRVYYQDISLAKAPGGKRFTLGKSRPLPEGFPQEVPIYDVKSSVVIATGFQRGPGGRLFYVSFLTKDDQSDVIDFYTQEFEGRGWTVSDSTQGNTGFALAIDFADGPNRALSGSIQADDFEADSSYRRVDLLVQVTGSRGRGN